jgi:lysophospholipase L1-like esterase
MDPQISGWPLTPAAEAYVVIPEYSRKPGHESNQHLPAMWPVTPTAGYWGAADKPGNRSYLDLHARIVAQLDAHAGAIDIMLLGDSITQHWGGSTADSGPFRPAWQERFAAYRTVNAGIAGDRVENVLWRLEHGVLSTARPAVIVLLIGVNNTPLVAQGVPTAAIAEGIRLCIANIREQSPASHVIAVRILPFGSPDEENPGHAAAINQAVDALQLENDPLVHRLDVGPDMRAVDGTVKPGMLAEDRLHVAEQGYETYGNQLKVLIDSILGSAPTR